MPRKYVCLYSLDNNAMLYEILHKKFALNTRLYEYDFEYNALKLE